MSSRLREMRIMNIQAVLSSPDNHPVVSLYERHVSLNSVSLIEAQYRSLIDERRGHKETGVIRR